MCQVVSGSKLCKDTGYRNSNFSHAGFETLHGQNKSFYPEPLTTHLHTLTSLKVSAATPPHPYVFMARVPKHLCAKSSFVSLMEPVGPFSGKCI